MPHSAPTFDELCQDIIDEIKPRLVLDVGTGAGKYADLIRRRLPETLIVGYEPEPSYDAHYNLKNKYDELRRISVENVLISGIRERFDLCIFGDVLEHLRKSLGQDLIHFLLYRSRYILLVVPVEYLQDDYAGVKTEAHISSWHPREFEHFADVIYLAKNNTWLGILRGFLCDPAEFLELRTAVKGLKNRAEYVARRKI